MPCTRQLCIRLSCPFACTISDPAISPLCSPERLFNDVPLETHREHLFRIQGHVGVEHRVPALPPSPCRCCYINQITLNFFFKPSSEGWPPNSLSVRSLVPLPYVLNLGFFKIASLISYPGGGPVPALASHTHSRQTGMRRRAAVLIDKVTEKSLSLSGFSILFSP